MLNVSPDRAADDNRRGIERELKRGSLELIVLHLLSLGEAYGYEIVSTLTARTDGSLEVTDGTLYPVLYRLERGGFVAIRWETPQRGVPRKYYRLTKAGQAELARLTHEWNTFANAMARLLRQQPESNMSAEQSYINRVIAQLPHECRRCARRSRWSCAATLPSGSNTDTRWTRRCGSSVIPKRWPSPTSRPCR